jgi:tetratricopeptide (TPR) repeat protein
MTDFSVASFNAKSASICATRYRMLETIRHYALEKLKASGEAENVQGLHAEYYLAWAQQGMPPPDGRPTFEWLGHMRAEHDNLQAALTWSLSVADGAEPGLKLAVAMARLSEMDGLWSQGRARLEDVLVHADAEGVKQTDTRAEAYYLLGILLQRLGDYTAARAQLTRSLAFHTQAGNLQMRAVNLGILGVVAREQGDAATARASMEEVLAFRRESGNKTDIAWTLVSLGEVGVDVEDTAWATSLLQESLHLFREMEGFDRVMGQGWACNHLGHVAQLRGDYEEATRWHEESLALFREYSHEDWAVAEAYQSLGETALGQRHADLARERLSNALDLFRQIRDRKGMAWCLAGLAGAAALDEEPERAAWLWGAAEALRQALGVRHAPASRVTRERSMASTREELGEDAFAAVWEQGASVSTEEVIAQALRFVMDPVNI